MTDDQIIDELFLATLARKPKADEVAVVKKHLESEDITRQPGFEDVLWNLINHVEFLFQH